MKMSEITVTVQRSSNVYKALPGLWHTLSTKPRTNSEGFVSRESVTGIVTTAKSSKGWKTIEESESHHWFQVRDPKALRRWIKDEYFKLFNKDISTDNFLISDVNRAYIQIYPRVFRCQKCLRLFKIKDDANLGNEVNQRSPNPSKVGIACPKCGTRPINQQPHILINYETGDQYDLPTKCPNGHPLRLKYSGSAVSILGWKISCDNKQCEYGKERDPYAKKSGKFPYFPGFYKNGKKLSITPTTRGPRQSFVITKVDTMPFDFKPDSHLLASLFMFNDAPSIEELFNQWIKIRAGLIKKLSYINDKRFRLKTVEQMNSNDEPYIEVKTDLFKKDDEFKQKSNNSDRASVEFNKILLKAGIKDEELSSYVNKLRFRFDEIINLSIANSTTYQNFLHELSDDDPRKEQIDEKIDQYEKNLRNLYFENFTYLSHEESTDELNDPDRNLQIVKVALGTKVNDRNIPFHRLNYVKKVSLRTRDKKLATPCENNPLIFGTNHPVEALYIKIEPSRILELLNINGKTDYDSLNVALIEDNEQIKKIDCILHTLSHILIRRISEISGLGIGSLSHRIFPHAGSILLFTTIFPTLGQLREVFEGNILELTDPIKLKRKASNCPRDPICSKNAIDPANCFACLHIPDHCCDGYWNRSLDRRVLWNKEGIGLWN